MTKKEHGYLLLELLLACGCLGLLFTALLAGSEPLAREYYRQELRLAAYTMAADIRILQRRTMFQAENNMYALKLSSSDKQSYGLYKGSKLEKKVSFANVSLSWDSQLRTLSYSENGSPSGSGNYVLKHTQLAKGYYQLSVQPVTGRVTIYEK